MVPRAYIVHRLPGRLRLRIRDRRQDPDYFAAVRRELEAVPGIDSVRVNGNTGSILLLHPQVPHAQLASRLRELELFELAVGPEPAVPALASVRSMISELNQAVDSGSSGGVDLRALVVLAGLAIAIRQMMRGELLGPALPLLWSVAELAMRSDGWPSGGTGE